MELSGELLLDGALVPGRIVLEGERIAELERDVAVGEVDEAGRERVIAPGFIDLHVHGFGGFDPLEDLAGMARALAAAGTTGFQPTLFPREPQGLGRDCAAAWEAAGRLEPGTAARVVGLHLEGPFLNPDAAGAIPVADLVVPSVTGLAEILGPATGGGRGVKTVTLAPEVPGASDVIAELVRCGVRVSLGHSRASGAEARLAARAGAVGATHLYNAMTPLHHRDAGLAGTALTERTLFAEIIGDLVHVERQAFEIALGARGPAGLCLVSDALRGAGTGCEVFHAHGREHLVSRGAAFYPPTEPGGAPRLAGGASSQLEMVRRLVAEGVCDLAEALTMASATPARALGLEGEVGVLREGARADLIVLEGSQLEIAQVYVAGRPIQGTALGSGR